MMCDYHCKIDSISFVFLQKKNDFTVAYFPTHLPGLAEVQLIFLDNVLVGGICRPPLIKFSLYDVNTTEIRSTIKPQFSTLGVG